MGQCISAIMNRNGFDSQYELREEIGRGTSGIVYRCIRKSDNAALAAKKVSATYVNESSRGGVFEESLICKRLRHENIIMFKKEFIEPDFRYLVFELVEGRHLFAEICDRTWYSERDVRKYITQILNAVKYLHNQNIVHRDIEPSNILLRPASDRITLIDFGFAARTRPGDGFRSLLGSPMYLAPEILRQRPYGKPVDLWACGVILYNLLSGIHPFTLKGERELFNHIINGPIEFPPAQFDDISEYGIDLVNRLTHYNPSARMDAAEALEHAFITQINFSTHTHRQGIICKMNTLKDEVIMQRSVLGLALLEKAKDDAEGVSQKNGS